MRLKKIKLAGFKSFVDPTTLDILSPLVGVVGPNGCGKSNVIDAVRWVMGESSAKNLRGESMSDVIFNGSTTRKPVGLASIELVFDNSDGSLGGEYASFAEISIRRQAGRDNQSDYFLNGTRCRRRDITDIFLGTGLGPRSYAIIEQGMISRVIESKPDDLRAFFEEAAGISLYRRRRHETETRMRHTRENLARLDDVRQELEKQLERLKRQSEAAERYQILTQEQKTLDAELATIRWHALKELMESKRSIVLRLANSLEEKLAGKAGIDFELEKIREQHIDKSEQYNRIHSHYYEIGTQIARNEQSLEHYREKQQQLRIDLEQTKHSIVKITDQLQQDSNFFDQLSEEWSLLEPQFIDAEKIAKDASRTLEEVQNASQDFEENYEQFQIEAQAPQQTASVEKARLEQLDKQSRDATAQLARLEQEQTTLDLAGLDKSLYSAEQEIQEKEQKMISYRDELNSYSSTLNTLGESQVTLTRSLDVAKSNRQTKQGRLASLEALQQAAMGKTEGAVKEWLKLTGFENNARLAESIKVEPGFERAMETVLGSALEAVCVNRFEDIVDHLSTLSGLNITLLETGATEVVEEPLKSALHNHGAVPLINKVSTLSSESSSSLTKEHFQHLLLGIWVVDDLTTAIKLRTQLKNHESCITRDGIWLGRHWLRVYHDKEGRSGIFERDTEIKQLTQEILVLNDEITDLDQTFSANREQISAIQQKREHVLTLEQAESRDLKELTGKCSAIRTRLEHLRNRHTRIQEEVASFRQKLSLAQEETGLARLSLQTALDAMEQMTERKQALLAERDTLKNVLRQAEHALHVAKEKTHSLALKRENLKTQRAGLEQGILRLKENEKAMKAKHLELEKTLSEQDGPLVELRQTLDTLLEQRLNVEVDLNQARSSVEAMDNELHQLEKRRQNYEQEAEIARNELDEVRMQQQALDIRAQTVEEKLNALGVIAEQAWETLASDAEENLWSERLEQVNNKIQRLGAINLAAIEEFQSESERKNYLDSQYQDLTSALETLENAIKKIDRETRAKFKETFDKVNSEFQTLFPKLFGGGQAYLELIGEDLLEAGVGVMARPPGKRNSSIHLLSGGEKALTAVALVFAIFQLNPAPFCMLDEVDAPLDDANVGRFCELVKHMSSTVQFIYITHNKVTMEMAHHLVGVTMKEPGVSRLVTVDVAEAFAMATA